MGEVCFRLKACVLGESHTSTAPTTADAGPHPRGKLKSVGFELRGACASLDLTIGTSKLPFDDVFGNSFGTVQELPRLLFPFFLLLRSRLYTLLS
jgi:hypothetical protein